MPPTKFMNSKGFLQKDRWKALASYHESEPYFIEGSGVHFSVYEIRLNLLTYLKGRLEKKIRVIGVPLSVCEKGYEIFEEQGKLELIKWVQGQKGFTIILNANEDFNKWLVGVQTLPTVCLNNQFESFEAYQGALRSHYRYRQKQAEKKFDGVRCEENVVIDEGLYKLYEAVYAHSEYPLDKCSLDYFEQYEATCDAFYKEDIPLGFCQYQVIDGAFYFLFCGINYETLETYDTYHNMLLHMIKKAIGQGVHTINFGQTTEVTKTRLGAKLESRYMYIYHSHPFVRGCIKCCAPFIGYKVPKVNYRVFKEDKYDKYETTTGQA